MVLLELRVVLPLTLDELKVGQVYTQDRLRKEKSSELTVENLVAQAYDNDGEKKFAQDQAPSAIYTHKNLKILSGKIPSWVLSIVPQEKFVLETRYIHTGTTLCSCHTTPLFSTITNSSGVGMNSRM